MALLPRRGAQLNAYVEQSSGQTSVSRWCLFNFEVTLRNTVSKNNELFQEVTLLDLKMQYGSTKSGRTAHGS